MILLKLFLTFLKIGAVSFGGGYGMISLIRDDCLSNGWLTEEEFLNFIAVAESTPGPIAVNMASFVGSSQGGLLGAFLATLGVVLPSFLIILLIASVFTRLLKYRGVKAVIGGIKPTIVALILGTATTMLLSLIFRKMAEKQSLRLTINEGLLDFIKQNCCSGLSISDVATKCGYTPEHFSRIFKKYTGKTPISYLNDCKISTAKKLLSSSDLSIELIMQKCGFTNRTLFFKRFLKSVGCTPLQFRKSKKDTF